MTATTKGRGNSKSKRATPPNVNKPWPIKNAVNFLLAQLHYSHAPSLCQNAPMQLITTTQSNIATNKAKIALDCLFILHSEQDSHLKAQKTSFCFHNSHHRQFMESLWKAVLWHQVYASNSRKKKKRQDNDHQKTLPSPQKIPHTVSQSGKKANTSLFLKNI